MSPNARTHLAAGLPVSVGAFSDCTCGMPQPHSSPRPGHRHIWSASVPPCTETLVCVEGSSQISLGRRRSRPATSRRRNRSIGNPGLCRKLRAGAIDVCSPIRLRLDKEPAASVEALREPDGVPIGQNTPRYGEHASAIYRNLFRPTTLWAKAAQLKSRPTAPE